MGVRRVVSRLHWTIRGSRRWRRLRECGVALAGLRCCVRGAFVFWYMFRNGCNDRERSFTESAVTTVPTRGAARERSDRIPARPPVSASATPPPPPPGQRHGETMNPRPVFLFAPPVSHTAHGHARPPHRPASRQHATGTACSDNPTGSFTGQSSCRCRHLLKPTFRPLQRDHALVTVPLLAPRGGWSSVSEDETAFPESWTSTQMSFAAASASKRSCPPCPSVARS